MEDQCGDILKSATVMFGERLDPVVLGEAMAITKARTVFVAVGSSLQVQPAAGLAGVAADNGARLIIVNAEPTPYDDRASELCLCCPRSGCAVLRCRAGIC
ncbi:hypothetical protein GCM10010121_096820 [Streptomyces brasiliensis]|uniref:protein acetyllysine N-acetyltransferase n=1 Tax=Streptomyces brasiliensis TaxID=1954 RepID=A0A917UNN9_9ACTN|nr:hypothetical protein GCM10010121_096820 [Streptomyces brasiliensis]